MDQPEETPEIIEDNIAESPDEPVVGETGEETPQPSDDAEEFEIDLGSDEQESHKVAPVYKLNKLRKRAQKAEKQADSVSDENKALRAELDALRHDVAKVTAGSPPDILDYSSTDDYLTALNGYNSKVNAPASTQAAPKPAQQQPAVQADEAFFDAHYEKAAELKLKDGEFLEAEGRFRENFAEAFGDNGQILSDLVLQEAGDKSALVALALGKNDNETLKLIKALEKDSVNGGNSAVKMIWKLSEKVALKPKRNRVATEPTDIPKGKSNAGSLSDQITKAKENWMKNPSVANHKKLSQLRSKA